MTHCLELLCEILKSDEINLIKSHYTIDGLDALVQDKYDDKMYTINIKPYTLKKSVDKTIT